MNTDTQICGRCQRSLVHFDVHLLPTQGGAALTAVCPAGWLAAQVRALLEAAPSHSSEYSTVLDGLSTIHSVLRSSAEERYREELSLLRLLRAEARGQDAGRSSAATSSASTAPLSWSRSRGFGPQRPRRDRSPSPSS